MELGENLYFGSECLSSLSPFFCRITSLCLGFCTFIVPLQKACFSLFLKILAVIFLDIAFLSGTFIKHKTIIFSYLTYFLYINKKRHKGQRKKSSLYHILGNFFSSVFQFTNFSLQLYLTCHLIYPLFKKKKTFQRHLAFVELLLVFFQNFMFFHNLVLPLLFPLCF